MSFKAYKLRLVTDLHNAWLRIMLYGADAVSESTYKAVVEYGRLPMDLGIHKSLGLIDKDFAAELLQKAEAGTAEAKTKVSETASTLPSAGPKAPSLKDMGIKPGETHNYLSDSDYSSMKNKPQGAVKSPSGSGWYVPMGAASSSAEPNDVDRLKASKDFGRQSHSHSVVLDHLGNGEITHQTVIGDDEGEGIAAGVNESHRVQIAGNGRGIIKPANNDAGMYHPSAFYTGAGSVPVGTHHKREAAVYNMAMAHGLSDLVPPTTIRSHQGKSQSIQQWMEDHSTVGSLVDPKSNKSTVADILDLSKAPDGASEEVKAVAKATQDRIKSKMMDTVAMDILWNHNDRHSDNMVLKNDGSDFKLIDNGFAVGNGVSGIRSFLHKGLSGMGEKVVMSDNLKTQLKNKSLTDYKKCGEGLEDWAVGQNFLRNRYLLHVQETDGHIPYEKFLPTMNSVGGTQHMGLPGEWGCDETLVMRTGGEPIKIVKGPGGTKRIISDGKPYTRVAAGNTHIFYPAGDTSQQWHLLDQDGKPQPVKEDADGKYFTDSLTGGRMSVDDSTGDIKITSPYGDDLTAKLTPRSQFQADATFKNMEARGTLPNQLFEKWAYNYANTVASNPDHPDHADIKALLEKGFPLLPPEAVNKDSYVGSKEHGEYLQGVAARANKSPAQLDKEAKSAVVSPSTSEMATAKPGDILPSTDGGTVPAKEKPGFSADDIAEVLDNMDESGQRTIGTAGKDNVAETATRAGIDPETLIQESQKTRRPPRMSEEPQGTVAAKRGRNK